jgi:hypothetical protein
MKLLYALLAMLAILITTHAQYSKDEAGINKVKEEIRSLLQQLNKARLSHDSMALENIYAKEFINIHSAGFIDDRQTTIHEILTTENIRELPIPSFDGLTLYGNAAVLRTVSTTNAATVNSNRLAGTYIYVKKDDHWQIALAQGTPLQKERKIIQPDSVVLKNYTGTYERNAGELIIVEKVDGNLELLVVGRGIPKRKLMATSDTGFYDKLGTEYSFSKNETDKLVLTTRLSNGQESKWLKK